MKTAMQEHFEWLQENQLELGIPIEAIDNAEDSIYKEKKQIIDFAYACVQNISRKYIEKYYNQTYNQNK